MSIFKKVSQILSRGFIFHEDMSRILSLALQAEKNALIFGPGGHAKSAMVQSVISGLELGEETFFQFFGEGMTEDKLFGGLDFAKLESEKVLEYFPERSFLNFRIAVFEELFDAPANVLLALKDVLTAHELRNGSQWFKMRTEVIIVLTNKDPEEISELGPAAHALIERFPLQLELKWHRYDAQDYAALFDKVASRLGGPKMNGFRQILAEILAKATVEGNFVSPRTAVHAYEVCQAAALLREGNEIRQEDLVDLRFVPGLDGLAETIEEDLRDAMARAEADQFLTILETELSDLVRELEDAETPIKALVAAKKFAALGDEASQLRVPDAMHERRKSLRESTSRYAQEAQQKALEVTRVAGISERQVVNFEGDDVEEEPRSRFGGGQ